MNLQGVKKTIIAGVRLNRTSSAREEGKESNEYVVTEEKGNEWKDLG